MNNFTVYLAVVVLMLVVSVIWAEAIGDIGILPREKISVLEKRENICLPRHVCEDIYTQQFQR